MSLLDYFLHLGGFALPALTLAALLALAGRWLLPRPAPVARLWLRVAINTCVGIAVLVAGLWWFGRDGKMATYGALVLAMASAQWALGGGWRR